MTRQTVHNPDNERHYMQLDVLPQTARIVLDGLLIAETREPLRLLEVGKGLYPPQYYIPESDIVATLVKTDKSTHCPLKGDASYFSVVDGAGNVLAENLGWSYPDPFDFAGMLAGRIAFDPKRVSITIEAE